MIDKIEHDLTLLPQWGPYTKKYIGASHIADANLGIRFDLSIFPGVYRRKTELPNVVFETSHYPWQANTRLTHYKYRHMIEWQDRVFVDVDYLLANETTQLFRANIVNNTAIAQTLALHLLASIHFAGKKEYQPDNYLQPALVNLADGALWVNSNQYSEYVTNNILPTDNLNADGKFKHETLEHGYVHGSRIEFALTAGDKISYDLSHAQGNIIQLRYFASQATSITVEVNNQAQIVHLPQTDAINLVTLTTEASTQISLIANEAKAFFIDGLLIGDTDTIGYTTFNHLNLDTTPEIIAHDDGYVLKYPQLEHYYGVKFFAKDYEVREFISDNLDTFFAQNANEHVLRKIVDKVNEHHYSNWYLRPLNIAANSQHAIFGLVTTGSYTEVCATLAQTTLNNLTAEFTQLLPEYAPTTIGQQIISATMLTNVVYPVYTCGKFIRHSTPGRWWDCLYTWDSGFIGLGLLELDIERAKENLRVYLTSAGAENKFIHHGSPVPVQFYLANEIYNQTHDNAYLAEIFASLVQYYQFLRGKLASSNTDRFASGLLQTWSYFYNSGGWDDYPAQKYCHDNDLIMNVTPVITTSHVIRCAKILIKFATQLKAKTLIDELNNDIDILIHKLNQYSWDEDCGYYSYVMHDADGKVIGKFSAPDGSNFNQGLDGLYTLVATIGNNQQTTQMLAHLQNPAEINSPVGLSAVSQSASYYRNDGYWNGTVWFSHQWFFWKAMFDYTQTKFADQIARTALEIWERECSLTYRSLEHFVIETGRGAGWSTFGGLSCPQLNWYHAYYQAYRVNVGLDCLLLNQQNTSSEIQLTIQKFTSNDSAVLVVLPNDWQEFSVYLDGTKIEAQTTFSHQAFWFILPQGVNNAILNLQIQRK